MDQELDQEKVTLQSLVNSIEFCKPKKKSALSETQSISSSHTVQIDHKEKSKLWTEEEIDQLKLLIRNYGTDFHILSSFFPKKTKNQIKNKYKQIAATKKKQEKAQKSRLMAIASLFKEADQKEEDN